jgi:acid stress-induced BolA-like protein IbaG/YrbA
MATREQLQHALEGMADVDHATVDGDRNLIATVVSPAFREQNEAERQESVWSYLHRRFGPDELQNIEFIITNTPEEATP